MYNFASESQLAQTAMNNVMQPSSKTLPDNIAKNGNHNENDQEQQLVRGYDFDSNIITTTNTNQNSVTIDYDKLFESYLTTGFQATNFAKAVNEINQMVILRSCDSQC